ncbi:carboxymuconolactone decarboxylase family protein [Pendulispora brunnea]|uniref:Carboxymuconolactone decarboxylase family protein n=1 Tax=Pendulispora brunnea TaxID=2905690 RepID=A0ABZ2KRR2_9BACT
MSERLPYFELSKAAYRKLFEFSQAAQKESIDSGLRHLIDIRASQINGCAFCVDMHVKEATIEGERALRLHHIATWRESPLFSEREKMALEWTEAVTNISTPDAVPDALYEKARTVFSEKELSDLTLLIGIINTWNRLSVAFRAVPGSRDQLLGITNSGLV